MFFRRENQLLAPSRSHKNSKLLNAPFLKEASCCSRSISMEHMEVFGLCVCVPPLFKPLRSRLFDGMFLLKGCSFCRLTSL